jgi:hypothetical protein
MATDSRRTYLKTSMAKTATKKKPAKQPDLFDRPRTGKSSPRKGPKASARTTARTKAPARSSGAESGYTAKHIEVLEGLEPVRRRPGMYIGGTDEKALHHLFAEVIDNAAHGYLSDLLRRGDMEGKLGATLLLHNVPGSEADRVLLVGLGKEKEFREKEYRSAIATARLASACPTTCLSSSRTISRGVNSSRSGS